MVNCNLCLNPVSRNRPGIFCDGCKNGYHAVCVTKTNDILQLLETIPGLYWKCPSCVKNCILLDTVGVRELVETKLSDALASFREEIRLVKKDINKISESEPIPSNLKYSEVLKDRSQPAVIVHPKDGTQSHIKTKADILCNINPLNSPMQLTKVKTVKDGGVLISCRNKDDNEKLKSIVQQKMSDAYHVKEVGGVLRRMRIVGMTVEHSSEDLCRYLLSCNKNIFPDESECKIIKIFPTRRNAKIFQAIILVNKSVYDRALNAGNVFVAYDSCTVYDAFDLYRCYKCNEFNHSSQKCIRAVSCPVCAGDHDLRSCKAADKKCSNCLKQNRTDIDTNHAVWEKSKCSVYINTLSKLRSNISDIK